MLRSHNCGELRLQDIDQQVTLCGWVSKIRNLGGMTFIDLRDRYGTTQLVYNMDENEELCQKARAMGREYVLKIKGKVQERSNKNPEMATGDIEITVNEMTVLNSAATPPFTIRNDTDGGARIRMQYRYLDLRRPEMQESLWYRHRILQQTRRYLDEQDFLEVETPFLIKSTPEGARDFVVPSRLHPGQFYALPQSPQTFKQLLMVGGIDKYFQIVRCFRDEDLRADRQPEFTQIDCEMSFVEQEDVLQMFEGLVKYLFKQVLEEELPDFERISYQEAIRYYGTDRPDLRFGMPVTELNEMAQNKGFKIFDKAELVAGIKVPGCADYSRKQLDELEDFVTQQQIGAKGLIWVKCKNDGTFNSSVDKFFEKTDFEQWKEACDAEAGDLLLIIAGKADLTRYALGQLRLEMGDRLGLRDAEQFKPLYVINFPLVEWNEEEERWDPSHHPFTAPKEEDLDKLESDIGKVRAQAYDLVINGVEIAGGSLRIHNRERQERVFDAIGVDPKEVEQKFSFLMEAFEYGAPPHGGIAFGFDRLVALMTGKSTIRDVMAFPKDNAGRDVMLDAPSDIDPAQLKELGLEIKEKQEE